MTLLFFFFFMKSFLCHFDDTQKKFEIVPTNEREQKQTNRAKTNNSEANHTAAQEYQSSLIDLVRTQVRKRK